MSNVDNGRTHDPSLRELTAQIDGMVRLYEERDRRYEDRFKAADEKTALALTASKEAVSKAEAATEKRFDAVNEFRGTLSDQARLLLPRAEADSRLNAFSERIDEVKKEVAALRESRSEGSGRHAQQTEGRAGNQWAISAAIAFAGVLVAVIVLGSGMLSRQPPAAQAPATPPVVIYQSPPPVAPNASTDPRTTKGVAP